MRLNYLEVASYFLFKTENYIIELVKYA